MRISMLNALRYQKTAGQVILVIYLLSTFKIISPVIYYNLNQEYIIATLCENKDKVEMKCKGKCFLKKELKKTTEDSDMNKKNQLNFNVQVEFASSDFNIPASKTYSVIDICYPDFNKKSWINIYTKKESPPPKV